MKREPSGCPRLWSLTLLNVLNFIVIIVKMFGPFYPPAFFRCASYWVTFWNLELNLLFNPQSRLFLYCHPCLEDILFQLIHLFHSTRIYNLSWTTKPKDWTYDHQVTIYTLTNSYILYSIVLKYPLSMGWINGFSLKFSKGYQLWNTPEGWRLKWLKHCDYDNQNEYTCLST